MLWLHTPVCARACVLGARWGSGLQTDKAWELACEAQEQLCGRFCSRLEPRGSVRMHRAPLRVSELDRAHASTQVTPVGPCCHD